MKFNQTRWQRRLMAEAGDGEGSAGEGAGDDTGTGSGEGTGEGEGEGTGTGEGEGDGDGAGQGDGEGTGDGQGDGEGAGEGEGEGEGEGDGEGEITYEDFTIPEDYKDLVTDAQMEHFTELAKDMKLSQEDAQKLVDYEIKRQDDMLEAYTAQTERWSEDVKVDEELGGANYELKLGKAKLAVDALASEGLQEMLDPYHPVNNPRGLGIGNHPEVVRLFYRLGSKLSEDVLVSTNTTGGEGQDNLSREEVMYPDT